jgi:hypothetical protein
MPFSSPTREPIPTEIITATIKSRAKKENHVNIGKKTQF